MKVFRFILFLLLTLTIGTLLNTKIDQIPPLGKFLSPFHGFWTNAENKPLDIPVEISAAALLAPVNVYFDSLLIPHIFAQNDDDLYYAMGYITASHRLWQMEFQLLAADGRVSEIIGERGLEFDRAKRRIGLGYGAQNSEKLAKSEEPDLYKRIEAYSQGVNDFISSMSYKDLPIEYKLLDYLPEKWEPYKCFLLIASMSDILSKGERDLEHTNALKLWGREVFDILYPERLPGIDPVIPKGTVYDFDPVEVNNPGVVFPLEFTDPPIERSNSDNGSNSFAVNGAKTENGKVILTNEPDLNFNTPCIWYVAHINSPGVNCMGAMLPGAPGIVIGFNDSIAWGNTNAKRDLVDWYTIQFKDDTRKEYLYNDNWVSTREELEAFKVRGKKTYYDTIIYTHLGPIVYDRNFEAGKSKNINLAMRWTAHDASKEIKAIYLVNRAKNYNEFVKALSYFSGPPQNYTFASASGDIAMWINGKFPIKWREQGKFLMDGSDVSQEWQGFMPHEHNLHVLNPPRNFVSSANQHAADTLYPYYQYDYNYEYYRGKRINNCLRTMDNITVEDVMGLQHDNFNYTASECLPMMLDSLDTPAFIGMESKYYNKLRQWNLFNDPEREAPTIFDVWWKNMLDMLWEEIDSAEAALYRPHWYNTYYILKNYPDFEMIDNQYTADKETTGDLFRATFQETVNELEEYLQKDSNELIWYKFKNTTIRHLLRLEPFSISSVKIGGNKSIVNAATSDHGPSWRMVAELGDGKVNAWGVYPGSQTANPGNPFYGHMIEDWAAGRYYKLLFTKEIDENTDPIIHSIQLIPAK